MELWLTLLLLQGLLPLALAALLLLFPWRSTTAWTLWLVATGAVLAALGFAGLWTVPPWWTWWVYAALWLLCLARGPWKPGGRLWPMGIASGAGAFVAVLVSSWAGHFALQARAGASAPRAEMPNLHFPLQGGTFLVVNGGSDIRVNAHLKVLEDPRFHAWRGNAHGVDLVAIDGWGRRASGLLLPSDLRAYVSQGWPVLAPCSGHVITAVDGAAEQQPPRIDPKVAPSGNHVILRCGDDMHVLLAHLQQGSVRVAQGQHVVSGQPLGAIGNSGRSDEPHLHIHVQRPGTDEAPFSGEPVAATFDGRYLVRGQRIEKASLVTQEAR